MVSWLAECSGNMVLIDLLEKTECSTLYNSGMFIDYRIGALSRRVYEKQQQQRNVEDVRKIVVSAYVETCLFSPSSALFCVSMISTVF